MIETTVQRFVKRKKIQPLLIESRYAILGYEIRYYLFIAWKWYKVKILWHTDNRLSAWNSIGLLVSPLTSASPRNAAHRYVTDILVREENSRGGSPRTDPSTLSGEDERKTKIWIGLVHFHPCGITMLSYLRSASLEDRPWIRRERSHEKLNVNFFSSTIFNSWMISQISIYIFDILTNDFETFFEIAKIYSNGSWNFNFLGLIRV